MERITTNGLNMPKLGLGTWPMKGPDCVAAVQGAIGLGYRHIDTAQMYGNESEVGEALAHCGVARGKIHVTTKVWKDNLAPDQMKAAMDASLKKLRTSYVDLYLIHWPSPDMDMQASIETLAGFKEAGVARAVGVSNFPVALLKAAVAVGVPLACNQVEYHVGLGQGAVLGYARPNGIAITAYSPLGRNKINEFPVLAEIAAKHGATPAQVALKWLYDQDGVAAIPKASHPDRQKANLAALDVVLDDADRAAIAALPKDQRQIDPANGPDWDPVD